MTFAILHLDTDEIADYGDLSRQSKREYAKRWGHELVAVRGRLDETRPATWSKILLCEKVLERFDWIWWLDADAAITNNDFDVRSYLDDAYDLILTCDSNGINAGSFLLRNSVASRSLLAAMWDSTEYIDHCWSEQAAMTAVLSKGAAARVKLIEQRRLNSYPENWQRGDLVIHCPWRANRLELLRAYVRSGHACASPPVPTESMIPPVYHNNVNPVETPLPNAKRLSLSQNVFRYMRPGDPCQRVWGERPSSPSVAGRVDIALRDYRSRLQSDPTNAVVLIRLAELCMASDRFFEAVDHFNALKQIEPGNLLIRRALADALSMCQRISEAVQEYGELLKQNPTDVAVVLALAAMLGQAGAHSQAAALLENQVRQCPDRRDVLEAFAQSLCEAGFFERGRSAAMNATRFANASSQTWNLLGITQLGVSHLLDAEASFDKALTLDPMNVDAHLNSAVTYKVQNRTSEALAAYQYATSLYRAQPTCWQPAFDREVSELSLLLEQRESSEKAFRQVDSSDIALERPMTVLVACYGAFPAYSVRVLDSIASGDGLKVNCAVHIGLNECCQDTTRRARELRDQGIIDLLIESPTNLNKDPMMRLLLDTATTPYILWIDDDNHFGDVRWPNVFSEFIRSEHPFDVAGRLAYWGPCRDGDIGYMDFIRKRPWWRSNEHQPPKLRNWIPFAPGGIFLARTAFLRRHDFPDRGMIKAMDDVALGEMIQQVGGRLVSLPPELIQMASSDGTRRGEGATLSDGVWR